jgi:DNA-binding response OmpR family regulator
VQSLRAAEPELPDPSVKLLLIENNSQTRARLADLTTLGFTVDWIRSVEEPDASALENSGYEVVLLAFDGLWNEEHWQALGWLLARVRAPVLITGPREALPWIERALEAGAEDFLVEPADPQDLAVRIRMSARRAAHGEASRAGAVEASAGEGVAGNRTGAVELQLNPVQRVAVRDGETIPLTTCEYIILAILIAQSGRIVARTQLQQQLYAGGADEIGSNTVEVYVHNLRRKLGERLIRTARGRGYWVDLSQDGD